MSQMQKETPSELKKFVINSEASRKNFQWNNPTKLEVWCALFLKRLTFLTVLIHLLSMPLSKYHIFLFISRYLLEIHVLLMLSLLSDLIFRAMNTEMHFKENKKSWKIARVRLTKHSKLWMNSNSVFLRKWES